MESHELIASNLAENELDCNVIKPINQDTVHRICSGQVNKFLI